MYWLYFVLFSVLGAAISNLYRRILMQDDKNDAYASTVFFQLMGFAIVFVISIITGFSVPPVSRFLLNFLTQAVLWGTYSLFLFKASALMEASDLTILFTSSSIVTIIFAVLFLHDDFNMMRLLGVVLIIFSVILVSSKSDKSRLNKGIWYALLSSACGGIAVVNDAYILKFVPLMPMLWLGWLTPGLFLIILKPKILLGLRYFFRKNVFKNQFLLTFFYTFGGLAYYAAINAGGLISQVSPISQTTVIVTVILGAIFLKERDNMVKKVISAILVTIGVMMVR